jgi:HK97 family phage portal protein
MRLLGLDISVSKAAVAVTVPPVSALTSVSFLARIGEAWAGAWQRNIELESQQNILKFSAVYACVSLIADDISKLRIKLVQDTDGDDIWNEITSSAFTPVLRKPNRYQTRIQFIAQWIVSKLLHGNAYVLKQRDLRGVVNAMFILDPRRVTPLVTDDGSVYYKLKRDDLAQVADTEVVIPASEVIHDRMLTLWHPLVGVSPIYACGASATQGIRIQNNSGKFFENMSRPSGILSAPEKISQPQIDRLKAHWEEAYAGGNVGRIAVLGDGLTYTQMTIPAADAQLIEQLRWTVEDVARCFHVPLHKLGMGQPTLNNIGALNQDYYTQCLQSLIESLELLLDEGLGLGTDMGTELDLEGLLRMDPLSVADANEKGVRAGILAPNEARLKLNLPPVEGGDLEALAKRDDGTDPFGTTAPPVAPAPADTPPPPEPAKAADLAGALIGKFQRETHVGT